MGHYLAKRHMTCTHCFNKSFEKIDDLFTFMDCDGNGLIDAKDVMKTVNKNKIVQKFGC